MIDFTNELSDLDNSLKGAQMKARKLSCQIEEHEEKLREIKDILESFGITPDQNDDSDISYDTVIDELETVIKSIDNNALQGNIQLTPTDITVCIVAGIVASIVDIVFVGTPEVVKIYKGGENFDGSILTKAIRSVGSNDSELKNVLDWCSEKCKVAYDISAYKNVVTPNNHRLRSFAHDPFAGVLFAVVDILLGTATMVDASGHLRIIVNPKDYPETEKYLTLIYYFGHLLSDLCTARGLPIPGFFLTQFFTNGEGNSIAKVAEQMYVDGYDLRHLASMSTPVIIKNLILDVYTKLSEIEDNQVLKSIAEKEIELKRKKAYKCQLRLISDAICCCGNVLKFFLPPTMGNMTALNLVEWISLIKNTLITLKYQVRDKDIETVLHNRNIIDDNWTQLMMD